MLFLLLYTPDGAYLKTFLVISKDSKEKTVLGAKEHLWG